MIRVKNLKLDNDLREELGDEIEFYIDTETIELEDESGSETLFKFLDHYFDDFDFEEVDYISEELTREIDLEKFSLITQEGQKASLEQLEDLYNIDSVSMLIR